MRKKGDGRANWLLLVLLGLSMLLHVLVLAHGSAYFDREKREYIELEVLPEKIKEPTYIPVPPRHQIIQAATCEPSIKRVNPVCIPKPVLPSLAAKLDPPPAPAADNIGVPDEPNLDLPKIFSWTPAASAKSRTSSGVKDRMRGKELGKEYLVMVRKRIKNHKKYPMIARKQHMQGCTRLRFLLRPDGGVEWVKVIRSSGYKVLDEAAVAAVRRASPFPAPPDGLFSGPVPLQIDMVFELM